MNFFFQVQEIALFMDDLLTSSLYLSFKGFSSNRRAFGMDYATYIYFKYEWELATFSKMSDYKKRFTHIPPFLFLLMK